MQAAGPRKGTIPPFPVAILVCVLVVLGVGTARALGAQEAAAPGVEPTAKTADLAIAGAEIRHDAELGVLVFEQRVEGEAGGTVPEPAGAMDGAPVLAYAFPTTLHPGTVGFAGVEGTLTFVVTSHPDFDDTPLWDENADGVYDNDGRTYHTHWVVLVEDERVPGGLAVAEVRSADLAEVLPPTNPGMELYLDSPGFGVRLDGPALRVLVPVDRVGGETAFRYDAVTAYLEVNTSDDGRPTLGIYEVYSLLSGDLSLPFEVR